jgi:hypothetical protein
MPQPRPFIQTAAQVLARYLRRGFTPEQARERVERESGELTPGQYQSAIRYAQRLEVIRQAAENADPRAPLRSVLGEYRPPGAEVDVPVLVRVFKTQQDLLEGTPSKYQTIYVRARWSDTIADVQDRAMERFTLDPSDLGEVAGFSFGFASGFLFTGGYGAAANQP